MPEPLPVKEFLDELDTQWNASNVSEPKIIEVTGSTNDPLRFNLNMGDAVFGRAGSPALEETPIGNWKFLVTTLPTKFCESLIKLALRDSLSETHLIRSILPPK